jgi:extracellular matrix regulatory protein A
METIRLINIGYGNIVQANRIISIINPDSASSKRLRNEAKTNQMLIDATQGRKTRGIIITDSNHVILTAMQPETLSQRLSGNGKE